VIDPILRNPNPLNRQPQHLSTEINTSCCSKTFAGKMKSLPNLFKQTLKSEDKRAPFDPVSLLNVSKPLFIKTSERLGSKVRSSQRKAAGGRPTASGRRCWETRRRECCSRFEMRLR
jgi:hypothetical protein